MNRPTDPALPPPELSAEPAADPATPAPAPLEPRQRWRLTFARDPVPADQVGRAVLDAWQETLAGSGLPVAGLEAGGAGRARIAFAGPLPAAVRGETELVDLWLLERRPLWAVREALVGRLPAAHRWIGAEDVWLGATPLAAAVVAADWRVEIIRMADCGDERLAEAARALIAAPALPRSRLKGGVEKRYDLRPLLAEVTFAPAAEAAAPEASEAAARVAAVDAAAPAAATAAPARPGRDGPTVVRIRTRIHAELGAGRPEEVVAALGETAGCELAIVTMTRERFLLADDLVGPPVDGGVGGRGAPAIGNRPARFNRPVRPRRR